MLHKTFITPMDRKQIHSRDALPPNWTIVNCYAAIAAGTIVWAWIITIPAVAFVAAIFY